MAQRLIERAEGSRRDGNGFGAPIEHAVARRLHDLRFKHAAIVVDDHAQGQLAIKFDTIVGGEIACAFFLDFLLEAVVIQRLRSREG